MIAIIKNKINQLVDICGKYNVRRLALFGSAVSDRPISKTGDIDFLVEFQSMPPARHADNYFGLIEDLEKLFNLPVDLIEFGSIHNPYFREEIEETQVVLYNAA